MTREELAVVIHGCITQITCDWNIELILDDSTKLGQDVGFSSMEIIELFSMLDAKLKTRIPYQALAFKETGEYRNELTIGELCHFIEQQPAAGEGEFSQSPQ